MAAVDPITLPVGINFQMVDPEGTASLRVVAGHAQRVGRKWVELGDEMFAMASAIDRLVDDRPVEEDPGEAAAVADALEDQGTVPDDPAGR